MNEKIAYPEVWVRIPDSEKPHRAIMGAKTFCDKPADGAEVLRGGFISADVCQECLSKMGEKKRGEFDPMSLLAPEETPEPKPKRKYKKKAKKKLKEKSQDDVNTVEFKTLDSDTD